MNIEPSLPSGSLAGLESLRNLQPTQYEPRLSSATHPASLATSGPKSARRRSWVAWGRVVYGSCEGLSRSFGFQVTQCMMMVMMMMVMVLMIIMAMVIVIVIMAIIASPSPE